MVKINRGQLVILFIFGVSSAMGLFAVWSHHQQGHRCLAIFGSETANLIRHAPRVQLYVLANEIEASTKPADAVDKSTSPHAEPLTIDRRQFAVLQHLDISDSRGLVHARHALIADASYVWSDGKVCAIPTWKHALKFTDGERTAILLLDFDNDVLSTDAGIKQLVMRNEMTRAEKSFFEKQLRLSGGPNNK